MHKYTKKEINSCMKIIYDNCSDSRFDWRGESLKEYANTPERIYLIRHLSELGYITLKEVIGRPDYIKLTQDGLNYFSDKSKKRKELIKKFSSQLLSGVIVAIITALLSKIFGQ